MDNIANKKVLIIEDDERILRVHVIKFELSGMIAITANDGESGLSQMIAEKPAVVLLDLMLPGKDGFWVMEEAKKNPITKNIPIVVLSNLGQAQDKEKAMSLGAKGFLVKADTPINGLVDEVKKYMKG